MYTTYVKNYISNGSEMSKKLLLFITAIVSASCTNTSTLEPVTVISYNVGVFSKYKENSMQEIARFVLDSDASLVAMNELDSCNRRHPEFQLEEFSKALGGWNFHFASALRYAGGAYGNGVVSKLPVLRKRTLQIPQFDGSETRSCAIVETGRCVFASVHLDHRGDTARLVQARLLNEWFSAEYGGCSKPVILCGDFNCLPDSYAIAEMRKCWTLLSGTQATYPSDEPAKCIDYVFALKDAAQVEVLSHKVYKAIRDASDHLPIVLQFK